MKWLLVLLYLVDGSQYRVNELPAIDEATCHAQARRAQSTSELDTASRIVVAAGCVRITPGAGT
jgi:hypothetical protein